MTQAPQDMTSPVSPTTPGGPGVALAPTSGGERIVAIDVLRGVVLLGILVMNVSFMGWPEAWAMAPLGFRDNTGLERGLWFGAEVFANMKMMSIFSLLFGAGVVMVADRAIAKGKSPAALHYKRMGWLLVIGLAHGLLMWYGDILVAYAVVGAVAYQLRRLPVRWLVGVGGASLCVAFLATLALAGLFVLWQMGTPADYAEFDLYETHAIPGEIAAYRGGVGAQFQQRWPLVVMMHLFLGPVIFYWWAGGMMLLGMAAMKSRLILGQLASKVYLRMLLIGVLAGLPLASGLAWMKMRAEPGDAISETLLQAAHFPTTLMVACGWVGGVMLLCKQGWFTQLSHPLACVGRMALTNYLGQTLIVTFIFYGHGLGHFAKLERPAMFGIVLAVWALQLIVSPIWLRFFRFGPMEWLWRSLTYLRLQPMLQKG